MSSEIEAVLAVAPPDLPDVALGSATRGIGDGSVLAVGGCVPRRVPPATARAYLSDLRAWARWCDRQGVHPLTARRHDVDAWVAHLTHSPQPVTGRCAAPATVVRRLSCLSGFYDYGLREVELLGYSPVANVRRPRVGEDSPTIGLDAAELDRLLTAAEHDSPRSAALVSLLVYNGLRIAEALGSEVTSLTYQRGHRVLRIIRKGGRPSTEPLAPVVLCSATALRCSVFRTPWAMPTLKRPGGTTVPGTTSIDIRPMRWPTTCTAADWRRPHRPKVGVIHESLYRQSWCPVAGSDQVQHQGRGYEMRTVGVVLVHQGFDCLVLSIRDANRGLYRGLGILLVLGNIEQVINTSRV